MNQLIQRAAATFTEVSQFCKENAAKVDEAFARYSGQEGYDWVYLPPTERKSRIAAEARTLGVSVNRYTFMMNALSFVKRDEFHDK